MTHPSSEVNGEDGKNHSILGVSIAALLLFLFCERLLGLGPTHTDDAIWMLSSSQGQYEIITSWAKSQGRIFAFVSGTLIYFGNYLQTTFVGNALHLVVFACFFAAFHAICAVYFGKRIAILTSLVNMSMFAVRWEGSVLTTYPIFAWFLALLFVFSVWLGRSSISQRSPFRLIIASLLLFASLNIHEGTSVLFAVLAILCAFADIQTSRSPISVPKDGIRDSFGMLVKHPRMASVLLVIFLYFTSYFLFRIAFPSQYEGNRFGSFRPLVFLPVLFSFSLTSTSLSSFFKSYQVNYADAVTNDGESIRYSLGSYFSWDHNALLPFMASLALAIALFCNLNRMAAARPEELPRWKVPGFILASMLIAFVPVLPVSLVGKYQESFFQLGIQSYAFTPLCHFGWSMLIALGVSLLGRGAIPIRSIVIAALVGFVSFSTFRANDAVVSDIRRETNRWAALDKLNALLDSIDPKIHVVYVPRFASGSWFTVVPTDYWESYMENRFGRKVFFRYESLTSEDLQQGAALMDYTQWPQYAEPIVWVAPLQSAEGIGVEASEVRISFPDRSISRCLQTRINYTDSEGQIRSSRLASLPSSRHIFWMTGIHAKPESISLSRDSHLQSISIACEDRIVLDARIRFGSDPNIGGILAKRWFGDDWHPIEPNGRWSKNSTSRIHLPHNGTDLSNRHCRIELSTLTGLGFSDVPQRATVLVAGRPVSELVFTKGIGFQVLEFAIGEIDTYEKTPSFEILVDPVINPSSRGISGDNRDLGALVRFLEVDANSTRDP